MCGSWWGTGAPGYIHLQTCGKQSEFRHFAIISKALLFLNSQPLSGAILPKIKTCTFIYIPSMCMWAFKALVIFRWCAGSSEPSLLAYTIGTITSWTGLFHEIKYVNIKFIKMQNGATINLFLGTCMCVCAYALVGPTMCSYMVTNRHAAIGSTVC